jgi:hypothetical protein
MRDLALREATGDRMDRAERGLQAEPHYRQL